MMTLCCLAAHGQPADPLASNKKGLAILRSSIAAHGGAAATDSLRLAFSLRSDNNITRGQSLTAEAPFEPQYAHFDFMIDKPAGLETESRKSTIAGFVFESKAFYKNGKGCSYDLQLQQYMEVSGGSMATGMPYLPQNILAQAMRAPLSVRYAGETVADGRAAHVLTFAWAAGVDELYIDKQTGYLLRLRRIYPGIAGEELNEFLYQDYQRAGKLPWPRQAVVVTHSHVYGNTANTFVFSNIRTDFSIDTGAMKVPAGFRRMDYSYRKNFEARQLARDVYLLENITGSNFQWSYNVLFVVMNDYVIVAEAPLNGGVTEKVLAKIREMAPGKPVKYLVQSHHHDDHLGGIRGYIAEGAAIITTAGSEGLIRKIAAAPYNASPDRLALQPKPVIIETVKNKKMVLKDANHEVVIYDVGPNAHANEMLVLYLPQEKILYEADHINKDEYPMTETGRSMLQKIKALGLAVAKIASLHGRLVEGEAVDKLMATGDW